MTTRCETCGVTLRGTRSICPLCARRLDPVRRENFEEYPVVPMRISYRLLNRLVKLWGLCALAAMIALRIFVFDDMPVFWPLCLGVAGLYVLLLVGIRQWKNLPKSVMYESIVAALLCIAADALSGWSRWSLNYVIPSLCGTLTIFFYILCVTTKQRRSVFGIYFLFAFLQTVALLVLTAVGIITVWLPTVAAVAVAAGLMIAMLVFRGRYFGTELSSRFHL
ncbi:MAG: DUF6320 domain-containing protein [Oscillospiraceae bacterium]|nr:DUF6320 domain-containing protein [Oscillospiraceae bacterium]